MNEKLKTHLIATGFLVCLVAAMGITVFLILNAPRATVGLVVLGLMYCVCYIGATEYTNSKQSKEQ